MVIFNASIRAHIIGVFIMEKLILLAILTLSFNVSADQYDGYDGYDNSNRVPEYPTPDYGNNGSYNSGSTDYESNSGGRKCYARTASSCDTSLPLNQWNACVAASPCSTWGP